MLASLSGTLATMSSALPYAYAAKVAYPARPVVAIAGNGAMQMSGLNMLVAIADAYRQWQDPRLVVLVVNHQDLNFVTCEQRAMLGVRKFERSQRVPDFPYARYGEMLGLESVRARCSLTRDAFPCRPPQRRHLLASVDACRTRNTERQAATGSARPLAPRGMQMSSRSSRRRPRPRPAT